MVRSSVCFFRALSLTIECSPGRFFAALEAKALLAYILINYDFGLEQGGSTRPPNRVMAVSIGPDPTVRLRLHRREPVLH